MHTNVKLKPLSEQVVVVTGASSGIGLMCAKLACQRGARVAACSNNGEELNKACQNLRRHGARIEWKELDVSIYEDVLKLADFAVQHYGGFDTWINNAGVHIFGKIKQTPVEDMRRVFDVNYWGVVHGCRAAAAHLKKQGGAIINVGSVLSSRSIPLQGVYTSSKHAVQSYTETIRVELEKENAPVAVTLVKPSSIATPVAEHSRNLLKERARLPAPVYAAEVAAKAILFCAENPRRTFVVGGAGKTTILMEKFTPAILDKLMEKIIWPMQKAKGAPLRHDELYGPTGATPNIPRAQAEQDFPILKSSVHDKLLRHPWMGALNAAAAAGLGFFLVKDHKKLGGQK